MKILEILLIVELFSLHVILGSAKSTECLIQNNAYKFEYLYPSSELPKRYNPDKMRFVYTSSLSRIKNLDTLRWRIIQVKENSFYFKSVNYSNEYMCATSSFTDLMRKKRKIQTRFINSTMNIAIGKECEWNIEKANSESNVYNIWNVLYREPMYSVSYFFKFEPEKRNVYLWHKPPNSIQFEWIIDCRVGGFLKNNTKF
jgi:hypothetical protein